MLIPSKKYSEVSSVLQGCSQSTCPENKGCWCTDVKKDAGDGAKDGAICLQSLVEILELRSRRVNHCVY